MKWITDKKIVFKHISTWCILITGAFNGAWQYIAALQQYIDVHVMSSLSIIMLGIGFIGKFIVQFAEPANVDTGKASDD